MRCAAVCIICACLVQSCCSLPLPQKGREMSLREWELTTGGAQQRSEGPCSLCLFAAKLLQDVIEANSTIERVFPVAERMCVYFMEKFRGYDGQYMCPGIVLSYGPVFLHVFAEGVLQPQDLCVIFHFCNRTAAHGEAGKISFSLNNEKVAVFGGNGELPTEMVQKTWMDRVNRRWKERGGGGGGEVRGRGVGVGGEMEKAADAPATVLMKENSLENRGVGVKGVSGLGVKEEDVIFLHLSDIHLDQQYSEGSPSQCNLFLCCRSWYNGTGSAGHYGEYNCDLPLVTLDLLVETLRELDPRPDFIIYTGDNSPHDLWNETWASQTQATQFLVDYLSQQLPHTLIYPAIGNHETWPESEYLGTLPQYQEWTKKMALFWQSLVPLPPSALSSIADGAYYTLLLHGSLRLLSFNTDYGFDANLYSALNDQNPQVARQQEWMMTTLEQAEEKGEKVLLIGHVPPGHTSVRSYEEFYLNFTKKFKDTIVGHLFGHTHHDEFKLVQDEAGIYGTVLISPSVTPHGRSNPSFRLFTMDSRSYRLLEYQQYHLNLTLANEMAQKGLKPKFELAYTTSDLYDLHDLSSSSYAGLIERFTSFPDLVSKYTYNVHGCSNHDDQLCDPQCMHDTVCTVSNIVTLQKVKCMVG